MRKILAVLLAVMMLVGALAALPVFAAEEPAVYASGFDGTKSNEKMNDLIITEIVVDSTCGDKKKDNEGQSGANNAAAGNNDAFDFIEVYNNSDRTISLYDYCILSATSTYFFHGTNSYDMGMNYVADAVGKFSHKNYIRSGDIHNQANCGFQDSASQYATCVNPASANLKPGQVAVIWFWNAATEARCDALKTSLAFDGFREHYGMDKDTLIVATNAKGGLGLDLRTNRVYALCKDASWSTATQTWHGNSFQYMDATKDSNDNPKGLSKSEGGNSAFSVSTGVLHEDIVCLAEYTERTAIGIVTSTEIQNGSANYLPAYMKPHLYIKNQQNKLGDQNYTWNDFLYQDPVNNIDRDELSDTYMEPIMLENGLHMAHSYRESAIAYFGYDVQSAGKLPVWQWLSLKNATADAQTIATIEAKVYDAAVTKITPFIDGAALATAIFSDKVSVASKEVVIEAGTKILSVEPDSNGPIAPEKWILASDAIMALYNANMKLYVADWADAAVKTEAGRLNAEWESMAMTDYLTRYIDDTTETETGNKEDKKDYSLGFVDRDYLIEKHSKKDKTTTTAKKGLPTWALILIIVGGVLVLAGIAVVVIIIIKKKNRPVAADDIAPEGDIKVIDESEAPAVEEAPAENDNE